MKKLHEKKIEDIKEFIISGSSNGQPIVFMKDLKAWAVAIVKDIGAGRKKLLERLIELPTDRMYLMMEYHLVQLQVWIMEKFGITEEDLK